MKNLNLNGREFWQTEKKQNDMKDKIQNIQFFLIIILCFIIIWNLFKTDSIKKEVKKYKKEIELVQTKIDSVNSINKVLDSKISKIDKNIETIDQEIFQVDNKIKTIKIKTDEKINVVHNYSPNELEQFFTDRYK